MASAADDQSNHTGFWVEMSSRTLESTRVPGGSVTSGQPLVSARISSVLMPVVADPLNLATALAPQSLTWIFRGTMVTFPPETMKSTSASGSNPYRSRMACGMVT